MLNYFVQAEAAARWMNERLLQRDEEHDANCPFGRPGPTWDLCICQQSFSESAQ